MMRRILFWTHLVIGVAAGIAILIMSVTGVVLAFERQILQFADRDLRHVTDFTGARPRSLADMLATVSAATGATPSGVVVRPEPSASVEFTIGRDRNLYVDPYSGAILGEGSRQTRAFFSVVERWHRTLGESMGARGPLRAYAAASNLIFLLLVLSGCYLWLPRRWTWTAVRAGLWFRSGLRGRAREWNWHNAAGLWCALPLLLITLTGVIISYPWANALLFRVAGSPVPVRQEGPRGGGRDRDGGPRRAISVDLDRAVAVATAGRTGWRTLSLRISPDPTVAVTLDSGAGGEVEKRLQLMVDTRSGQVVKETRFIDGSLGQRLRSLARFTHTGEEAGLPGQIIAALASAGGVLLVWTGISLAIRRLLAYRRDRFNRSSGSSPTPTSVHVPGSGTPEVAGVSSSANADMP